MSIFVMKANELLSNSNYKTSKGLIGLIYSVFLATPIDETANFKKINEIF